MKIKGMNFTQKAIEALSGVLQIGQDNAIHLEDLADRLGVSSGTAKKMVNRARKHLHIISNSHRGYWLASSDEEWTEYKKQWLQRTNAKKFVVLSETSEPMQGQISLSDVVPIHSMGE